MRPTSVRIVHEEPVGGDVPLWVNPEWRDRMPWLVQGTTGRGDGEAAFDLGLSGAQPVGPALSRWRALRQATSMETVVHALQVHGTDLQLHERAGAPGLLLQEGVDGHLTALAGVLLSVSVADCVPVFVVDEARRAVAALHSGWRGTAAGMVEKGIAAMGAAWGSRPEELRVHCGPSICGECYEVGPEVHAGVRPDLAPPARPTPIDLRAAIAERAEASGVPAHRVTRSGHCTRCGPGKFFSHRGGAPERQMGVLGISPERP